MAPRKRNDRRTGSNAGTVFWLAVIVIILFVFALNWSKIQATLANTNFHEIVKTQTGAGKTPPSKPPQAEPPAGAPPAGGPPPAPSQHSAPSTQSAPSLPVLPEPVVPSPGQGQPEAAQQQKGARPQAPGASVAPPGTQVVTVAPGAAPGAAAGAAAGAAPGAAPGGQGAPLAGKSRTTSLFFVRVDDDGVIVRQEVKRQIAVSDSPLLDSMSALLNGPNEEELRKKLISLVPQGTKLLSAQVRGSTAYLNFNEAFMYNHYGIEGYAGQLKQVVYTATAYPNVQDVQILIEGEKKDYLGGEGVYIGKPLSRNSF
jgi:hypothetical protein